MDVYVAVEATVVDDELREDLNIADSKCVDGVARAANVGYETSEMLLVTSESSSLYTKLTWTS